MAQGRIKRLQSAARAQPLKLAEIAVCTLCDRPIPPALRDAHHLIPKSRGGVNTVFLHRACHKQVHALLTETELARFIEWVQDKPNDFNPPTRRSRSKDQF